LATAVALKSGASLPTNDLISIIFLLVIELIAQNYIL